MEIRQIGHMVSDFSEKFGIPRQSGLVEELESLGQATKNASLERTESQRDDDMWNESATQGTATQGATQAWGDDWAENEKEDPKDAVESMGGWGDTDLAFSDDNEEEKENAGDL